jgi:hypothetical protein
MTPRGARLHGTYRAGLTVDSRRRAPCGLSAEVLHSAVGSAVGRIYDADVILRTLAVGVLTVMAGCSWLFQDHLHHPEAAYASSSPPECTAGNGWAVLDLAFAALNGVGAVLARNDETLSDEKRNAYTIGGIGWALVHSASAITGMNWAATCRRVTREWVASAGPSPGLTAQEKAELAELQKQQPSAPPAPEPEPRGWYCLSSTAQPTVSTCVREKASCEAARDAVLSAIPDVGPCTLVETAVCFGDRCSATKEACEAQRAVAGSSTTCEERP